ncbi:MAG TPA: selenite/tellurite reduction operon rhodanese-like protein ExtH [Candidatus Deferrimicrobiaceae bacterium]|jgi:3-mercaptopyruvate sulfurtransferase SseA
MSGKKTGKARIIMGACAAGLLAAFLVVWGCGGYDQPTVTKTPTALISADTLKNWADSGLVNGTGFERVVVVEITDNPALYSSGHIPGAVLVNKSEIDQNRMEGSSLSNSMVADGAHMDAILQRCGIDRNTTVVFTTSVGKASYLAARGYFVFRYWGFPKARLKVLDGQNAAWLAAYSSLDNSVVNVAPSTFSVRDNGGLAAGVRASLGEMMAAVRAGTASNAFVDGRGSDNAVGVGTAFSYDGDFRTTAGVFPAVAGDYVVFEGHMKGATALTFSTLFSAGKYLPADNLAALFAAKGASASKTNYVYCRTGYIASALFFALDGILDWPTQLYDGSWSQWGQQSTIATAKGGKLPSATWATDVPALSELVVYNQDNAATIEAMTVDAIVDTTFTNTSDPAVNQIEKEDAAYMQQGAGSTGSGGGTGGGAGGGC